MNMSETLPGFTPDSENIQPDPLDKLLSEREQTFADEYIKTLSKAKAGLAMGSPEGSARQQGYEVYNRPHVKAYIIGKLKENILSAEDTLKLVSDTAVSSITDYYRPVKTMYTPKLKVPLIEVIAERRLQVKRELTFRERASLNSDQIAISTERVLDMETDILRLIIELEENPNAYRIVDGPTELVEMMQLDINALVADKERGRVKKVKYKEDGTLEVELYSAESAQERLLRYHGSIAPSKFELTGANGGPIQTATQHKVIFEDYTNGNQPTEEPGTSTEPGV